MVRSSEVFQYPQTTDINSHLNYQPSWRTRILLDTHTQGKGKKESGTLLCNRN